MCWKYLFGALMLFLVLWLPLSCGGGKYTVAGSVLDSGGGGIPNVTVTMGDMTTTTDNNGRYGFMSVSNGTYTITPTLPGAVFTPPFLTITVKDDNSLANGFIANWRPVTTGTTNNLYGISYVNNNYFTAGASGILLLSQNARTWTALTSNTSNDLYGVAFGNSRYIAAGANGTLLTSPDGTTWSALTPVTGAILYDILYDATVNVFVAVGSGGTVIMSTDGATWNSVTSSTSNHLYRIASFNAVFYAVGAGGTIITSRDGRTWSAVNSGTTNALYGITFGNNTYVATGTAGTVLTSADGVTWSSSSIGASNLLGGVAFGGINFVAAGTGAGNVYVSTNAATWTPKATDGSASPPALSKIIYGGNIFVAVGNSGVMYLSATP